MPQVTLLREPWFEYAVVDGRGRTLRFHGGESRQVSVGIAKQLRRALATDGSSLFRIVNDAPSLPVPDVGGWEVPPPPVASVCNGINKEQNVLGTLRQMGLKDVAL